MTILSIDFETQSAVDLTRTGVYPYAASPTTRIWCMAYKFDDEPTELWDTRTTMPERVFDHVSTRGVLRAWNAQFERVIWNAKLADIVRPWPNQWYCTAAEAAAMSLPRHLGHCAQVLGVVAKDEAGAKVMKRLMVAGYEPTEEELQQLFAYCRTDVDVERAIYHKTRRLDKREQGIYWLDQKVNDRGVCIDRPLVLAARQVVTQEVERANDTLVKLTDGDVGAVTQVGAIKKWLAARGVEAPSLNKQAITELLATGVIPEPVRDVLLARQAAGKSSVAKLDSMLTVAGEDDALRGMLLYHGASTGRWTGKLVQLQNFPRGTVKVTPDVITRLRVGIGSMAEVSSALRGMLLPRADHQLYVGDYSAIEARVLSWLADDREALELFRTGRDPYKVMASAIFKVPYDEVTPEQRQVGKAAELGCGFGMGADKFVTAAYDVYGIVVDAETASLAVTLYREVHSDVKQLWYDINRCAMAAVREPGSMQRVNDKLSFRMVGNFLWALLPSGRPLCYPAPKLVMHQTFWMPMPRECLEFGSVDAKTRRWGRERTYGGKLTENIVQAIARDVMADAMVRLEDYGFDVLFTVHDEVATELPDDLLTEYGIDREEFALSDFIDCMSEAPEWARSMPIKVEAWTGTRYRK